MLSKLFNCFRKANCNNLILNYEKEIFNSNIIFKRKHVFTTKELKFELLDQTIGNKDLYSIHTRFQKKSDSLLFETYDVAPDLYILKPGKLGREYNKTLSSCAINFEDDKAREILFQVISGHGYFLLENTIDRKQVKFIKVKKGDIVLIPKKWAFIMINNSFDKNLVSLCLRNRSVKIKNNLFKDMGGAFVFYTNHGFIKNKNTTPFYHLDEYNGSYTENYAFNNEIGLYEEFIKLPEKFNFLK